MKCTRFEDWMEQHGEEPYGPAWEGILIHVRACPDCALASRHRSELLEILRQLPPPPQPPQLREMIALALDAAITAQSEIEGPSWFDELIEPLLRPIQIGLAIACGVMVMFLFSLSRDVPANSHLAKMRLLTQHVYTAPNVSIHKEPSFTTSPGQPVKISAAEIAEFMRRLEEYRRLHPEMERQNLPRPTVEMVGFRE